jgi:outer membrane cobalamin receptor
LTLKRLLPIVILFFCFSAFGQKLTISGYVKDAGSGENLIGASIHDLRKHQGAVANEYGFYSVTLKQDSAILNYSYVGYQSATLHLFLRKDTVITVRLQNATLLKEITLTEERAEKIQESTRMGTISIPISQIKAMPALMGETDVMKVLQLLPGVQGGSEGNSGLYVRGGGPDQNLILLDGVPVYNPSHLYGFFSTFNADAINHVELVKGGFPARYGGRLSSVVDIRMKEGDENKIHGQGSIGIIASKFVLEGPIKNNKTSFIISGRRSYLNLMQASIFKNMSGGAPKNYYFNDLNAKINHTFNSNNRLYLSGYIGADHVHSEDDNSFTTKTLSFSNKSSSLLSWGNAIAALRWNHVFNHRLFANVAATYSQYHLQLLNETNTVQKDLVANTETKQFFNYDYRSGIRDFSAKVDFDFIPTPVHYIRFGAQAISHRFATGVLGLESSEGNAPDNFSPARTNAAEFSVYGEDDFEVSSRLKINAGLHASAFLLTGKTYSSLQPRVAARFLISPSTSFKASYSSMRQYIHLLSNAGIGLPTDLWVPATATIRPQTSQQGAVGLARMFGKEFEVSVEAYYKSMNNVIEYKDGASFLNVDKDWQTKVEVGKGESHGAELLVQKKTGRWNGLLGYTLSYTNRQFDNLNEGRWFPYRYDRRHDAKVAVTYTMNERFQVGLIWVYGTGNAVTIPLDKYQTINGNGFNYYHFTGYTFDFYFPYATNYNSRNNYQIAPYHRMDLNASYTLVREKLEHKLTLSIYNAYNRMNPYYLKFGYNDAGTFVLKQTSLFGVMPSLTYSVKF